MTVSLPIRTIIGIVSDYYDIPASDVVSDRKDAQSTRARHVAFWLCRHCTPHSLTVISRHFGGRDRSTVYQALLAMPEKIARDTKLAQEVQELETIVAKATAALQDRHIKLKSEIDPYAVACRIVQSPREATTVSLEEMRAVAEALISHAAKGLLAKLEEHDHVQAN